MNRNIVLFDLDGTLTPPRKQITSKNIQAIKALSRIADVGIVTGSGISYVKEQIPKDVSIDIEIFPCNGTQHWRLSGSDWLEIDSGPSMKDFLGQSNYNNLLLELDQYQRYMMMSHDLPYTGTFISYRKSLLNWCPVGRDANDEERLAFEKLDLKIGLRAGLLEKLKSRFESLYPKKALSIKLGGSTSFDIFPQGWDKRYALTRIEDKVPWFVGDRCGPGGNDQEIFEALSHDSRSFETSSEKETELIIYDIISTLKLLLKN